VFFVRAKRRATKTPSARQQAHCEEKRKMPTSVISENSDHALYEPARLITALANFSQARILIVGDVMLDEYLIGDASRISPEAPVPVVRIEEEKRLVGGAGNVARNVIALGGGATLIGARGEDVPGQTLEKALSREGITHSLLKTDKRPTTTKTRILARQQQVLRYDKEDSSPLTQEENTALLALVAEHVDTCDAVLLSDYGKGILSQGLILGLHSLLAATGRNIAVLVDPKPHNISLYTGCSLLTPNAKESSEATRLPATTPHEIIQAGQKLFSRLGCQHLVITLGGRGMAVFENPLSVRHIPTAAKQVFDVTGAGDTVIATIALGLATGMHLIPACLLGNYAAGIVVGQVGAATATPEQVTEVLTSQPTLKIARWL
jgi:rfaE bifunctional protein kinase chain/domain